MSTDVIDIGNRALAEVKRLKAELEREQNAHAGTAASHASLRAELERTESLVSALQEQMSRLAEQHAKAVAEAREELREAIARRIEALDDESLSFQGIADNEVRATPLDSTPLAARIAELEADMRAVSEENERGHRLIDVADGEPPLTESMDTLAMRVESLLLQRSDLRSALAAEVERHQATAKVLEVQIGAWESLLVGGMHPAVKVFAATQVGVIREALASLPAGPRVVR